MTSPPGDPGGPTAPRGPGVPLPGATGHGRSRLRRVLVPGLVLTPIVASAATLEFQLFLTRR